VLVAAVGVLAFVILHDDSSSTPSSPTEPSASAARSARDRTAPRLPSPEAVRASLRGNNPGDTAVGGAGDPSTETDHSIPPDRNGSTAIKQPPSARNTTPETAISRYEAKHGALNKDQRKLLEDQLAKKKKPDPVPGAASMRDRVLALECSGPDAQSKYNGLTAAERVAMKRRCGAAGAALTDPR
jgi:hypothetical protein